MLTNAVALPSKILFGYVHLLVPINNTGNNHMKLRKLVVAVGLSICSPFCFSDIITSGDVSVIDGAFNSYPVDIGTASYQVWETSNFGYPGGETNISISIAEGARFETSIAEVSPGWTGPDNTGTESINASIEVTGSGSTWYSESIFLGFGDGAENMSGLSANLTVSDGGVIDSNIFIGEAGELAGDGTVSGDIENWGGVVSPGLSPGDLMIDGDFYMESGSILLEIGGIESGMFDALFVDGSINIMGG